jgi:small subunit ribosomal protein S7
LINKIMGVSGHEGKKHKFTSGRNSGKAFMVMQSVKKAFEIIEKKTNKNPIQMLVKAVINASPRAEITVIDTGGIKRPYAVDTASQRRVDLALRFLAHGSLLRSAKSPTPFYEALAEELISAANYDLKCYSIKKKENTERQALASR